MHDCITQNIHVQYKFSIFIFRKKQHNETIVGCISRNNNTYSNNLYLITLLFHQLKLFTTKKKNEDDN